MSVSEISDRKLTISFVPTRASSSTSISREEMSVSELVDFLRDAGSVDDKKKGLLMKVAEYTGDRNAMGLGQIHAIQADYDAGKIPVEEAKLMFEQADMEAIIHTTYSHSDDFPRYRIILPLGEPIDKAEYKKMMDRVNGAFMNRGLAPESWVPAQNYYYQPPEGKRNVVVWVQGTKVDHHTDDIAIPRVENPYTQTNEFSDVPSADIIKSLHLEPHGLYPRMLTLTARWVYLGLDDSEIELMVRPIRAMIEDERGATRARELDVEIKRMVRGARLKGFDEGSSGRSFRDIANQEPNPKLTLVKYDPSVDYSHTPECLVDGYMFKDVGLTFGPGGVAKTTTAIYEFVQYAMGKPFDTHEPTRPLKTLFCSAEDTAEMFMAKIGAFVESEDSADQELAITNTRAVYVGDTNYRLTKIENRDQISADDQFLDMLQEVYDEFPFDVIVFDPMVSFGVGESRVNDAEQALIRVGRMMVSRFDCAVEYIHHTGKSNAENNNAGQYGYRGGSAMGDGARRVRSIFGYKGVDEEEQAKFKDRYGIVLADTESSIVVHTGKNTYAIGVRDSVIIRDAFVYECLDLATIYREKQQGEDAELMDAYMEIYEDIDSGKYSARQYTRKEVSAGGLSKTATRDAFRRLKEVGCIETTGDGTGAVAITPPSEALMSPREDF